MHHRDALLAERDRSQRELWEAEKEYQALMTPARTQRIGKPITVSPPDSPEADDAWTKFQEAKKRFEEACNALRQHDEQ